MTAMSVCPLTTTLMEMTGAAVAAIEIVGAQEVGTARRRYDVGRHRFAFRIGRIEANEDTANAHVDVLLLGYIPLFRMS